MNKDKVINLFEINNINFENLPDGAHYIIDNDMKPIAVVMNAKYYQYLEGLMLKLRDKILNLNKTQ